MMLNTLELELQVVALIYLFVGPVGPENGFQSFGKQKQLLNHHSSLFFFFKFIIYLFVCTCISQRKTCKNCFVLFFFYQCESQGQNLAH